MMFIVCNNIGGRYAYIDVIKADYPWDASAIATTKHGVSDQKIYTTKDCPIELWVVVKKYVSKSEEVTLTEADYEEGLFKSIHSLY